MDDSTRNRVGTPSRAAPTTNSSAWAPRATSVLVPLSVKPDAVLVAVVAGDITSKSTVGSVRASAAAGTSSPVNAGR